MWHQALTEQWFVHKDIQGVGPIGAALKAGAEIIFCCPIWQDASLGRLSQDCSVVLHTHQRKQHTTFRSFLSKKKEPCEQLALWQHPRIRVPLAAARVSDQDRAHLWGSVPPQEWGRGAELGHTETSSFPVFRREISCFTVL